MNAYPFTRWRWRHPRLARFVPHRVTAWLVWREALSDPEFVVRMDAGLADVAAGRVVPWEAVKAVLDPAVSAILGPQSATHFTFPDGSAGPGNWNAETGQIERAP